jgi:hypothetical protein
MPADKDIHLISNRIRCGYVGTKHFVFPTDVGFGERFGDTFACTLVACSHELHPHKENSPCKTQATCMGGGFSIVIPSRNTCAFTAKERHTEHQKYRHPH